MQRKTIYIRYKMDRPFSESYVHRPGASHMTFQIWSWLNYFVEVNITIFSENYSPTISILLAIFPPSSF
jgi:hypothetical protein